MENSKTGRVIPSPKGWWGSEKICFVSPRVFAGAFTPAAKVFAAYLEKTLKIKAELSAGGGEKSGIRLLSDSAMPEGEYRLTVKSSANGDTVTVLAGGSAGASYALATLLQLCDGRDGKLMLPEITVCDCPESEWRGLLIDCARSRHPVGLLKKYTDLCWLYKISRLHLHLSDDEAYTLPSDVFPEITTPHMGYTRAEIASLVEYAEERGVMLVPEIDSPGHATALREKRTDLFGKNGIICFHDDAIEAMGSIYGEVCDMFPHSDYIHIGGDESRLGWWLDCDECERYGRSLGICAEDDAPDMTGNEYVMLRYLAHFIGRNADAVAACGRRPVVWEGFHKSTNTMLSGKDITVMSWDNGFQDAPSLLSSGFRLINCSWLPNYIVTPTWFYPQRDCFDWDVYSFGSISESSPYFNAKTRLAATDMICGGQLCSWGDTICKAFPSLEDGLADEMAKIRERLPALAENTWNRDKRVTHDTFAEAYPRTDALASLILQ